MFIFTNAMENLLRNKGRNILIMTIIFLIIATTVVALIINNTSSAVIEDYKTRFSSQVSISPDMEKVREEAMSGASGGMISMRMPIIEPELLLSFAQSEALQRSEAYASVSADSDSLTAIDQSDDEENGSGPAGPGGSISGSSGPGGNVGFSIRGAGNYRLYGGFWEAFNNGTRALVDDGISALPAADNECLVSQELAELNGIKVGDIIRLQVQMSYDIPADADLTGYADGDSYRINGQTYTLNQGLSDIFFASRTVEVALKVTGIYDDLNDAYDNENMPKMAAFNHRNEILTTLDTLLSLRSTNENNINLIVTYFLKSPDLLADFEAYARDAGLSDLFLVTTDAASYDRIVKPVVALKSITLTFMIVVLVLGAIILILLTLIAIRERKYEIGVLRAMGMKKAKVALGLWTELLVMTAICLVLGLGVGALAAQPITDVLITQQAEAAAPDTAGPGGPMTTGSGGPIGVSVIGAPVMISGSGAGGNLQPLSEMDIAIGFDTILEIIAIALLLATLSGLVSTSRITRYEPIRILMERN
ncbi:MAG: ABC transporter permease [Coriobacteriia bacterium]|nr:ABC transporter permease [Coriobacteriia bacterium]